MAFCPCWCVRQRVESNNQWLLIMQYISSRNWIWRENMMGSNNDEGEESTKVSSVQFCRVALLLAASTTISSRNWECPPLIPCNAGLEKRKVRENWRFGWKGITTNPSLLLSLSQVTNMRKYKFIEVFWREENIFRLPKKGKLIVTSLYDIIGHSILVVFDLLKDKL